MLVGLDGKGRMYHVQSIERTFDLDPVCRSLRSRLVHNDLEIKFAGTVEVVHQQYDVDVA